MNKPQLNRSNHSLLFVTLVGLAAILGSCTSSTTSTPPPTPTITTYFTQTNLVADVPATATAAHYDPLLVNPWGMTLGKHPWISANGSNSSTFYDTSGGSGSSIKIPMPDGTPGGAPSGIVSNSGSNFADFFIFSTEDGTLAGWNGSGDAKIVSDSSGSGAVYKGLAMVASQNQIWATDFHNNVINVFNTSFGVVKSFTDASIPAGYGPFGIVNIGDTLYVTYARQKVGAHDDSAIAGIGYVDRFMKDGTMIPGHFTFGGNLNSPWGIAVAPSDSAWGGAANAILIGNFGDGRITAFDRSGNLLGQLQSSSGNIISIDGLWAIGFNTSASFDQNKMYFTSGPGGEQHGIFGYLHPNIP